jgi:uncharacterized membrane protein SpoIIM required for sporulation
MVGLLYQLRSVTLADDPKRIYHEDAVADISHSLLQNPATARHDQRAITFTAEYRKIWREDLSLFVYCVTLFLASLLVGWFFTVHKPEYVVVLIPQGLNEMILDNEQWFSRLKKAPLLYGFQIAANNIKVCLYSFSLGILFGLGGLGIMSFNGVFIGAIVGYASVNGFADPLLHFMLAHGPLELTVIVASAFASLQYGRAFYMRPLSQFPNNIRYGTKRAFTVILGVTPWLILAAMIESFVSPFDYLPPQAKLVLGLAVAVLFWLWTFWPLQQKNPAE